MKWSILAVNINGYVMLKIVVDIHQNIWQFLFNFKLKNVLLEDS